MCEMKEDNTVDYMLNYAGNSVKSMKHLKHTHTKRILLVMCHCRCVLRSLTRTDWEWSGPDWFCVTEGKESMLIFLS